MAATKTPASSELERRKQVRLRMRSDIGISRQRYEGRTYYVVKDPVSLRYYRFKEQEYFLISLMDGKHTLDQAQKAFERRFRPDRLTLEDLEAFGQQLIKAGLVQNESPRSGEQLFKQHRKRRNQEITKTFTNILYIKVPIFDPERILVAMLPYTRFIFTTWFMLASLAFMLWAVMLVATNFDLFVSKLPSFHEFFSLKTVGYLWLALGIVKVIHEFGHGLSCKAFGGEVHEMGLLFLCLSPAMYCNVSDAWTLPNKWKRIIISGAGIYVELMIAALATFVWWNTPNQPFINYLALSLMTVCSVSTVLFNGNPFMRFDGYYVASDLLEIPNLRERSNRYLGNLAQQWCFGIETQPEPYMGLRRKALFFGYAVISYLYRWMITFTILYVMATFLKPYKLEIISQLLFLWALVALVGMPVFNLAKNYHKRGRLPDMKAFNATVTACAVAGLVLAFFFLPLPVSRIRDTGVVQLRPTALGPVPVQVSGLLREVLVKEGERVEENQVIAVFGNPDMETELAAARTEFLIKDRLLEHLDDEIARATLPAQVEKLRREREGTYREMRLAELRWKYWRRQLDSLELRAPRDGVVLGLPKIDEIGKYWEKDKSPPFCRIGDPTQLRVLLPVSPDDYRLLTENQGKAGERGESLPVVMRVSGRGLRQWRGRIAPEELPTAAAATIPAELANKNGGPLAIDPRSKPGQFIPQSQVYLVPVYFVEPDSAIVPGAMSQVKISCEYRSLAWWTWRFLSKTFDIGLL